MSMYFLGNSIHSHDYTAEIFGFINLSHLGIVHIAVPQVRLLCYDKVAFVTSLLPVGLIAINQPKYIKGCFYVTNTL